MITFHLYSQNLKKDRGFTLLEILLYTTAVGMMFFGLSAILTTTYDTQQRQKVRVEVEQQGMQIMDHIIHSLIRAESVSTPSIASSGSTLTLTSRDAGISPVSYTISGDDMFVSYAGGGQNILNNERVEVSNLSFTNLSTSGQPASIKITFTVQNAPQPPGKLVLEYTQDFSTTVTLNP